MEWELQDTCQGSDCVEEQFITDIQLSFRSRDRDGSGVLFYIKGDSGAEYMKLLVSY